MKRNLSWGRWWHVAARQLLSAGVALDGVALTAVIVRPEPAPTSNCARV